MARVMTGVVVAGALALAAGCAAHGGTPGFALGLSSAAVSMPAGGGGAVAVTVARHGGFHGDVSVYVEGLGSGAQVDFLSIPASASTGTLTFHLTGDAAQGLFHAQVRGLSAGAQDAVPLDVEVRGAPGSLDPAFGQDGIEGTGYGSLPAIGILPGGDFLASAQVANTAGLARFAGDGALDPTFGNGGRLVLAIPGGTNARLDALAVQPDGGAIAAGQVSFPGGTGDRMLVTRLSPAGTIDAAFGSAGFAIESISGAAQGDEAFALALQADGKIVAAGESGYFPSDAAVARFLPDGSVDTAFGSGGKTITNIDPAAGGIETFYAVAVQPDGAIVAAGGDGFGHPLLVRYLANGALDPGFGGGGIVSTNSVFGRWKTISLAPDGSILVGGGDQDFLLARFTASGAPDAGFGVGGLVVTDFALFPDALASLIVSSSSILAVGSTTPGNTEIAFACYDDSGALDPSFGPTNDGVATVSLATQGAIHAAVASSNGHIVVIGDRVVGAAYRGFVAGVWR